MNKQVADNIKKVIREWMTGARNYTFETRGIKSAMEMPGAGEYRIEFFLKVNGFFTDRSLKQEVELAYSSPAFFTQTLSLDEPDNPAGDANYLKQALDFFTQDCYDKIVDEMKKYPNSYTSDILYMK